MALFAWRRPRAALLCVVLMACGFARVGQAAGNYAYFFYDRPVPLDLDMTRIAVLNDQPDAVDQVSAMLSRSSVAGAPVEHLSLDRWWAVSMPAGARDAESVESLVGELAARPDVSFVSPVFLDDHQQPLLITQRFFVRFSPDVPQDYIDAFLAPYGRVVGRDYAGIAGLYFVESTSRDGFAVLDAANTLNQAPGVLFAEPDKVVRLRYALTPNDTFYNRLWGINNTGQNINGSPGTPDQDMDGPEAWDVTQGSATIHVGILDDGIQTNHPDLNIDPNLPGANFTGSGPADGGHETTCDGHGTLVAGCVAAKINNALGVVGIAPLCKVVAVKIGRADPPCNGTFVSQDSWTVSALNWCQGVGIRITNCSWGGSGGPTLEAAFETTRLNGLFHLASSGNDSSSTIGPPASFAAVDAVGALTKFGTRASFSNYGPALMFSAPGADIYSTDRTGSAGDFSGDYGYVDGTSFSSPYAAGVAALVLARNPSFTPAQIEAVMQLTSVDKGTPGRDDIYGWGFLNAQAAVNYVAAGPGAFNLLTPAGGATGVSLNPTFTWSAATGAQKYTLTIDIVPTFDSVNKLVYANIVPTTYTLTGSPLIQQQQYYWKVEASNVFGTTTATPASRTFTTFVDCNGNGVDDAQEIAANPSLDCNGNGRLDSCDIQTSYAATSLRLSPFGTGQPSPTYNMPQPRDAAGTVTLDFWALGDLNLANEYVDVYLNSTNVGRVYDVGSYFDCVEGTASLSVPAATFNAARANGGGAVAVVMVPSPGVNPTPPNCTGQVYIQVAVSYAAVPFSQDTNGNGIPDECEVQTGACCFANGSCQVLTQTQCGQQSGTYQGNGTNCSPNNCPQPTGACCFANGSCQPLTQTQCGQQGGTYQGNGTNCSPNNCPQPTGACCLGNGSCQVLTAVQCGQQSGTYQGDGSSCSPNPCAPPPCVGDMNCDGTIDFADIDPFVLSLSGESAYLAQFPNCRWLNGDANGDNTVDFADIDAFVGLLFSACP